MGNLSSGKSALVHRYLTGTYVQEESPEGKRLPTDENQQCNYTETCRLVNYFSLASHGAKGERVGADRGTDG